MYQCFECGGQFEEPVSDLGTIVGTDDSGDFGIRPRFCCPYCLSESVGEIEEE